MRWLPLLVPLSLNGCIPSSVIDAAKDRDGDGYVAWQLGGNDCNDAAPAVNPGMPEICGDGIDNNCDGVIDDNGTGAGTWYPDADGDGYGVDTPVSACTRPQGDLSTLDAGVDCDDTNPDIHPGATEIWYDGIDENCDGADDFDQDGDGYDSTAEAPGGTDCDDTNPNVHPGATEICGNHLDDDCDGTDNGCGWAPTGPLDDTRHATIVWADGNTTIAEVSAGDTNGDGKADVVVGGYQDGNVYLFDGPLTGTLTTGLDPVAHWSMPTPANIFGLFPSLHGDLDGDGLADLLLSNEKVNTDPVVYLFTAPYSREMTEADARNVYYGPQDRVPANPDVGSRAHYVADLDGDGYWTYSSTFSEDPSDCYLTEGLGAGTRVPLIAWLGVSGCQSIAGGPDFDGDGLEDVYAAVGDSVVWFSSTARGLLGIADGTAVSAWDGTQSSTAWTSQADFDDDGSVDLLTDIDDANSISETQVLFGPPDQLSPTSPRFAVISVDTNDGTLPLPPGDFNGDGHPDLVVVNVRLDPQSGTAQTWLLLFLGPLAPGTATAPDAQAAIQLPISNPLFINFDVADVDGDGYDDIIVGHLGYAWVIYGQGR